MKTAPVFAILLALSTPACLTEFTDYGSSYSESYTGYGSAPVYRTYDATPYYGSVRPAYYGGGYGGGYGGSYGGYSGYNRYNYGRYNGDDCDYDRNDHHSDSKKKSSSSDRDIRITDYNQSRKRSSLPEGYHPPEWWKERGYSIEQNTYKTRDGEVKGKKSSSSSKKKKD